MKSEELWMGDNHREFENPVCRKIIKKRLNPIWNSAISMFSVFEYNACMDYFCLL